MEIKVVVPDSLGAFAEGLAKFVADVKAVTGPGANSAIGESAAVLSAAVSDLMPVFANLAQIEADLKAKPLEAAVAVQVALVNALGL